jgi:hypothetical protein
VSRAPGLTDAFQDELANWREHPDERDEESPAWNWSRMVNGGGARWELRERLARLAYDLDRARSRR